MRIKQKPGIFMLTAGLAFAVVACGGGDQLAGIEGTGDKIDKGVAAGPVESFGSIYLNGVRFDTRTAEITINGRRATEGALELGMLVRVEGEVEPKADQGVAEKVTYDRVLKGHVETVSDAGLNRKALVVLGQVVLVNAEIAFGGGTTFEDLQAGMQVEVSGIRDGDGHLVATRVEHLLQEAADEPAFDVEGHIQAVDNAQKTFVLQQLVVDYASATMEGGSGGDLVEGQFVEVRGGTYQNGVLQAQSVHIDDENISIAAGTWSQVEGIVEAFDSLASFQVRGVKVNAENARVVRGSLNQLGLGVRLAVEGTMDDEGRLNASEVTLKLPSEASATGVVEDIDAAAGEFTVFGNRFTVDRATGYDDRSAVANRFFRLRNLNVGDVVEVFSRRVDGRHIVTRIRRLPGSSQAELSGPVTVVEGDSFLVMDVLVNASGAEGADLVGDLQPGDLVKVEGTYTGASSILATVIERVDSTCVAIPGVVTPESSCLGTGGRPESGREMAGSASR